MTYTGQNITILEGLEPVRKRPGMYRRHRKGRFTPLDLKLLTTQSMRPSWLANKITVTIHRDGTSVSVTDNVRGIPVDIHPTAGIPTIQAF